MGQARLATLSTSRGRALRAAGLVLVGLAGGCAGLGPGTTARTLDAGSMQVMARPTVGLDRAGPGPSRTEWHQGLEIGVHVGATDRLEVGGRMGTSGGRLDGKLALLRPQDARRGVDLSVAPSLGVVNYGMDFQPGRSYGGLWTVLEAPVLLGVNLPGGSQAIAGAGPYYTYAVVNGLGVEFLGGEFLLAFSWKVAEGFRVVPGLACVVMPSNDVWVDPDASAPTTLQPSSCEVGISVLVGGDR